MGCDEDSTPGANAIFASQQTASGGSPGAFREIGHVWTGPSGFAVAHIMLQALYAPSVSGAIQSIDFSLDLKFLGGSTGTSQVGYSLVLLQDGIYYTTPGFTTLAVAQGPGGGAPGPWQHADFPGVTLGDFPGGPDFSASGSAIQFGYRTNNSEPLGVTVTTMSGIDNWMVTVHPVPEPSTLLLLGLGVAGLAIGRRRACKDAD